MPTSIVMLIRALLKARRPSRDALEAQGQMGMFGGGAPAPKPAPKPVPPPAAPPRAVAAPPQRTPDVSPSRLDTLVKLWDDYTDAELRVTEGSRGGHDPRKASAEYKRLGAELRALPKHEQQAAVNERARRDEVARAAREAAAHTEGAGEQYGVRTHLRRNMKTGKVETVQEHQRKARGHKVVEPTPEAEAEPEATPEPEPEAEAEATPEPEATAEPEPEVEPTPEAIEEEAKDYYREPGDTKWEKTANGVRDSGGRFRIVKDGRKWTLFDAERTAGTTHSSQAAAKDEAHGRRAEDVWTRAREQAREALLERARYNAATTTPQGGAQPSGTSPAAGDGDLVSVGEHLHGSRKDLWTPPTTVDVSNLEEVELNGYGHRLVIKKSVITAVDHAADRADGVSPGASHLKAKVLAAVATGPQDSPAARRDYVEGATWLQKELDGCKTVADVRGLLDFWRDAASGSLLEAKVYSGHELLAHLGTSAEELRGADYPLGGFSMLSVATPADLREKAELKKQMQDHGSINFSDPAYREVAKKLRALEERTELRVPHRLLERHGYTDIGRAVMVPGLPPAYRVYARVAAQDNVWKRYLGALSGGDARGRLSNVIAHRGAFWTKDVPHARAIEREDRWDGLTKEKGKAKRSGTRWTRATTENMRRGPALDTDGLSGEQAMERLGLRGIQYGEWVDQASREEHLHRSYEACVDLAEVLGLDPKMISNGGALGLALGARGKGKAAAHYEALYGGPPVDGLRPGDYHPVINLTHTEGSGSLAHEWGHFLDHHLTADPRRAIPAGPGKLRAPFASHGDSAAHDEISVAARKVMDAIMFKDDAPPGVPPGWDEHAERRALKAERKEIRGMTDYAARALALDKYNARVKAFNRTMRSGAPRRTRTDYAQHAETLGSYWHGKHEMFARAFESYVEDKIHEKGRLNTYLVEGTKQKYEMHRKGVVCEPYPHGAERERINKAMEDFIGVVRRHGVLKKAMRAAAALRVGRRNVRLLVRA